jgi:antirestriction protein ArdC
MKKIGGKMRDIYKRITDIIIEKLENNIIPWNKPFVNGMLPTNLITKKTYKGINRIVLTNIFQYEQPFFITFKQCKDLGGKIKKGEKGSPVVYWGTFEKGEDEETKRTLAFLKASTVFNVAQCENLPENKIPDLKITETNKEWIKKEAENIVENMNDKPMIYHSEIGKAFYSPLNDFIHMPNKKNFKGIEEYYSILFHELIHSTGHEKRLKRRGVAEGVAFGDENYSKEELVAEIGSAFLCALLGFEKTIENQAAYIKGWLDVLKNDKKIVISAAAKAQKAADYILGRQAF